jgi:uncharacterized protein YbjQ (UPF0145 family)
MYLSTLQLYDTSLYKPGNIIVSTDVQAVSGLRDMGAQIMGVFGGSSELMDKKVKDVVQESMSRFVKTAQTKNAQAAIGITTDVNAFVDKDQVYIMATITGTPLMNKNKPALPVVPSAPAGATPQMPTQILPQPVGGVPMPYVQAGGRRRRAAKRKTVRRR